MSNRDKTSSCAGKVRFESYRDAEAARVRVQDRARQIYRCDFFRGLHLGFKNLKKRPKERA